MNASSKILFSFRQRSINSGVGCVCGEVSAICAGLFLHVYQLLRNFLSDLTTPQTNAFGIQEE